jgi:ketosteroid isomerase-like protein
MLKLGIALMVATTVSYPFSTAHRQQYAAPAPEQQDVESAIRAAHAEMQRAAERLDGAALYALVLDTSTPPIIENGELADTWTAALARTTQGLRGLTRLAYTYTRQSITVLSPTTALWIGVGTASATLTDGRQIEAPFAETVVFAQRDGHWKVLHAHRSVPNR